MGTSILQAPTRGVRTSVPAGICSRTGLPTAMSLYGVDDPVLEVWSIAASLDRIQSPDRLRTTRFGARPVRGKGSAHLFVPAYSDVSQPLSPAQRTQAQKEDALPRLNLEHQRKRARALLKRARAQDPDALRRLDSARSRPMASNSLSLHDAQRVVARENGFATWARLKAHVQSEALRDPFMLSALVAAANRALETDLARPLYRDPFARHLAGDLGWALLGAMRRASWPGYATGPEPYLTVMTRFFDDALRQVVAESAIRQVVILNAGMDTRAYRLAWPPTVTVFEVDRSDVFEHKKAVLDRIGARAACRRQVVAANLHGWARALLKAGFDSETPTAVLIERLHCLDSSMADRLLCEVTTASSPGSWIGLALPTEQTRCSPFMTPYLHRMEELGLPTWRFGLDEPEVWLATYGWDAASVAAGAPEASYGRWPYVYIPREPAFPRAFFTQGWLRDKEATCRGSR